MVKNSKNKLYCDDSMEAQIRAYLKPYWSNKNKGEPLTHQTKDPGGRYNLYDKDDAYDGFIELYCSAIDKGARPSVMECPSYYNPCRSDIDMKSNLSVGDDRQYTREQVIKLIKIYQRLIKKVIDPETFENKHLYCILLEKKAPRKDNGIIKDGFHLHFPHFICEPWITNDYLRTEVCHKIINAGLWQDNNYTNKDDIIDSKFIKNRGACMDLQKQRVLNHFYFHGVHLMNHVRK